MKYIDAAEKQRRLMESLKACKKIFNDYTITHEERMVLIAETRVLVMLGTSEQEGAVEILLKEMQFHLKRRGKDETLDKR